MSLDRNLILRHFINEEAALKEFSQGINHIKSAIEVSETNGFGFRFGLKLTVDEKKLDRDLVERVKEEKRKLPRGLFYLYDSEDRGSGTSYRQILFNPTFSGVVVCADFDQYIINTKDSLEQILELVERVERTSALYATGSRDIPVRLAVHESVNILRIIQELMISLAVGSKKLRIEERKLNVTPAYAKIGESVSGFYTINHAHNRYPELAKSIFRASQVADMRGFATDFYVVLRAAELGRFVNGYVTSRENKFYGGIDKKKEFQRTKSIIFRQTRNLRKTDIAEVLLKALGKEENMKRISEFYPKESVEYVKKLMVKALANSN